MSSKAISLDRFFEGADVMLRPGDVVKCGSEERRIIHDSGKGFAMINKFYMVTSRYIKGSSDTGIKLSEIKAAYPALHWSSPAAPQGTLSHGDVILSHGGILYVVILNEPQVYGMFSLKSLQRRYVTKASSPDGLTMKDAQRIFTLKRTYYIGRFEDVFKNTLSRLSEGTLGGDNSART